MRNWVQALTVIGVMVAVFGVLVTIMVTGHTSIRADMNADHAAIRADVNAADAEIRADIREIRTYLMGSPVPASNPIREEKSPLAD